MSKTNTWWTITLMALIIIALATHILIGVDIAPGRILRYISYGSTLLSITLSVFAILYTFLSNNKIDREFADLNRATNEIKATNELLKGNLEMIIRAVERTNEAVNNIPSRLSNTITGNLPNLSDVSNQPKPTDQPDQKK